MIRNDKPAGVATDLCRVIDRRDWRGVAAGAGDSLAGQVAGRSPDRAGKLPILFPARDMCTTEFAVDGVCRTRSTAATVKLPSFHGFSVVLAGTEGW